MDYTHIFSDNEIEIAAVKKWVQIFINTAFELLFIIGRNE